MYVGYNLHICMYVCIYLLIYVCISKNIYVHTFSYISSSTSSDRPQTKQEDLRVFRIAHAASPIITTYSSIVL